MNDAFETLRTELTRQDEAFADFEQTLRSLGDVELAVPQAFLDELEELGTPHFTTTNPTMPFFGIRG